MWDSLITWAAVAMPANLPAGERPRRKPVPNPRGVEMRTMCGFTLSKIVYHGVLLSLCWGSAIFLLFFVLDLSVNHTFVLLFVVELGQICMRYIHLVSNNSPHLRRGNFIPF
jgi:hypothetical protein